MNKIKSIPVFLVAVVLCLILIDSCSDKENPVIPADEVYQFDSSRYEWSTDTIDYPYINVIFGFDSSNVYFLGNHALYIYDGKSYTPHNLSDLYFNVIGGIDPANVFIGGSYPNGDYRLVKWNGISFQDIPTPSDTTQDIGFTAISVKSEKEIWLASQGKLFFYDGTYFKEFEIDSTSVIKYFTEQDGKLLASGRRYLCPANCDAETNIYQFGNNIWTKIYSSRLPFYEPQFYPVQIGEKLFGNMQEGIFGFDNSNFHKIINSPFPYLIGSIASGKDINQILTVAFSNDEQFYVNWNGSIWSKEFVESGFIENVTIIDQLYYTVINECSSCNYVLIRKGRPK